MSIDLALVGATGLVGEAILEQLAHRDLPVGELFVLASENSEGKSLRVGKKSLQVRKAEEFDFSRVQLAVFAAGAAVSQELAPRAADAGALVLDLSPAFRYEPDVPLLVLSFWTVADNIKTGAAYNAVLLVEKLLKDYL